MSALVKMSSRLLLVLIGLVALLGIAACSDSTSSSTNLVSIALDPAKPTITVGATQAFKVQGTNDDKTTAEIKTGVTWSSSDVAIATVSDAGVATALKAGSAKIKALVGALSAEATLTVTAAEKAVVVVVVAPSTATIAIGTSQNFTATATFDDGTSQDVSSSAMWKSDKTAIATVDAKGHAAAVAAGAATISATYKTKSGSAALTVTAAAVTAIGVTPSDPSIPKGTTQDFTATATLADATTQDVTADVTWTSSRESVATVDAKGQASGVDSGATTITAALNGVSGSTSLTVTGAALQSVQVTLTNPPALPIGATFQFHATGSYSDGTTVDLTEQATWTSSKPSAATVSDAAKSKGLATGVSGGATDVTAALGPVSSNVVRLNVQTGVTLAYVTLAPPSATINAGQTTQFAATGHYSDSSAFDLTSTVTWAAVRASADTAVTNFTISATGLLTGTTSTAALPGGKGRVKASQGSVAAYADVTVKDTTITDINVDCSPSAELDCIPLDIGFEVHCRATATFSDDTSGDITGSATWTSKDRKVAALANVVGGDALFTVVGKGSTAIIASQGGKDSPSTEDSNAVVRGVTATRTSVTVTPPSATIPKGGQQQYAAIAQFTSATSGCSQIGLDVTDRALWLTSSIAVATISNAAGTRGLAEAQATGDVQIQTVFAGVIGYANLTVGEACLETVTIEQRDPTYPVNVTTPLTVRGTYSDGATARLVPGVDLAFSEGAVDSNWNLDTSLLESGSTTVTFSASALAGTCKGAVKSDTTKVTIDAAPTLTGLSIEPDSALIVTGGHADFISRATFAGLSDAFNVSKFATWSNTPAIAGLAKALRRDSLAEVYSAGTTPGTTTVTAVYGTKTATAPLGVSGATVTGVTISGVAVGRDSGLLGETFPVGLDLRFLATVAFSDGTSQVNPAGTVFASDAPGKLAFVAGTNRAHTFAASQGTNAKVAAAYQSVTSAAVPITIDAAALRGLLFAPNPVRMPVNSARDLEVRGAWDGAVTYHFDLSNVVSCSTGNSALVAVSGGAGGTRLTSFGTATGVTPVPVTCLEDSTTGSVNVTVNDACVTTIAISPAARTIPNGATQDFVATATFSDGSVWNASAAGTWATSSSTVLADLGIVQATARRFKAQSGGAATVGYSLSSEFVCAGGDTTKTTVIGNSQVTVSAAAIASVVIQPGPIAPATERVIPLGETVQLRALATLTDGATSDVTSDPATTWSVQAADHATIFATGAVTGVAVGTTIVEVHTANGKTASLLVKIEDCGNPLVNITTTGRGNLPIGTWRDYVATAVYLPSSSCDADGTERTFPATARAQWISSAPETARIQTGGTNPGRATAIAAGTATIRAVYRGASSNQVSLKVVSVILTALQVQPSGPIQTFVGAGSAVPLRAVATYSDGSSSYVLDPPPVTWLVVDPTVATIGFGDALTGLKVGSTTFRAQSGAIVSDPVTVNVSVACITAVDIVTPTSGTTVPAGVPLKLETSCQTSDGSRLPCNPTFSVVALSGGASVDDFTDEFASNGQIRLAPGATTGTATLRASVAGCTTTVTDDIDVKAGAAALAMVILTPTNASTPRGTKRIFRAIGWFPTGPEGGLYDLTAAASYSSTNIAVATPDNDGTGNVTAGSADGNSLITASYLGVVSNGANLEVSGKQLTSVAISADANCTGNLGGGVGAAYPTGGFRLGLHATGAYSDSSSAPLGVTWSLDAPIVAGTSIDPLSGVLTTGTAAGTQTVRASSGSIEGTFKVGIVNAVVASVTVSGPAKVPNGVYTWFGASVTLIGSSGFCDTNSYEATGNVAWVSSDSTKGAVVASGAYGGLFRGFGLGTTNLTAIRGSATGGPVVVTITNAVRQSVRCEPATVSLHPGDKGRLRAIVTYSDATEVDEALSQADWNASITTGASRAVFSDSDAPGVVTAVRTGSATVAPVVNVGGGTIPVSQSCQLGIN